MTQLPAPDWVEMTERGDADPRLKGMRAPNGIHIEIVASDPVIIDPVGMTFADDGSLFVLEWREATEQIDTTYDVHYQDGTTATVNRKTKNVKDELKQLRDTNGDGIFDSADLIMNDLEMPSSILLHDGWMYFPSIGHVIRRRPATSSDRTWEEEEILRGMCGYHHHQVSGLTIGHDNWMYTTTGDDDNRRELATELFLALRTQETARGLDQLLNGDTRIFTESQLGRLLTAHRHIVVHPPIDAAGVSSWLEHNPDAPAILQVTALETLGLTGGGRSATVTDLTVKLLNRPDPEIRLSAIKAAGQLRVIAASRPLFEALSDSCRSIEERQEIIRSLALLRTEDWPYADRGDPGVELILPELIAELESWKERQLIADGL